MKKTLKQILADVKLNENRHLLSMAKNIQLFADDNGGGEPKTYSAEEYEALLKERDNLKNRTDELSKNEKALKEQLKSKLSDEEKGKQEREEIDKQLQEELAKLKADNLTYKIKGELASGGFESGEIDNLTKHIIANDVDSLIKELSTQRKNLAEKLRKEIIAELQKQNKLPNGFGGNENEVDPNVQNFIDNKKALNKSNARDFYLKR